MSETDLVPVVQGSEHTRDAAATLSHSKRRVIVAPQYRSTYTCHEWGVVV